MRKRCSATIKAEGNMRKLLLSDHRTIVPVFSLLFALLPMQNIFAKGMQAGDDSRTSIDLSQAKIFFNGSNAIVVKAAQMLQEEIQRRTHIALTMEESYSSREKTPLILLATAARLASDAKPPGSLSLPHKKDAYAIWSDPKNSRICLLGYDPRGVLFAAGRFLRLAEMKMNGLFFPAQMALATAPEIPIRGHQLGYRGTPNSYDAWDESAFEQYLRDLILFGTNAIELVPTLDPTEPRTPLMKLSMWDMNMRLSALLDSYGLDVWCWIPVYVSQIGTDELAERELERWRALFRSMKRLDAVFVPGGDGGDTPPEILLPWLQRLSGVLSSVHPGARLWLSNQTFEAEHNEYLFEFLHREHPDWLEGIVFGPWTKLSLPELRRRIPARYAIRRYPDISHCLRSQYPVPDWNRAFAHTLGREPVCPRPRAMAHIHNLYKDLACGFITYSEGIHDDLNKIVWSALGWDSTSPVETILEEYAKVFLNPEEAKPASRALLRLEDNWTGPILQNQGIAGTLALWTGIADRRPEERDRNWRLQMYLFRACYDAYVQEKAKQESLAEARIYQRLRTADPAGISSALEEMEAINEQTRKTLSTSAYRRRIVQLGKELFAGIGFQLSVLPPYLARNVERGAVLDTLDYPLSDADWIESQWREIKALADPAEQSRRIRQIIGWEDPGPGGFYDDLGNPERSPHLVRQKSWREDPGGTASSQQEFIDNQDWRLSWQDQAQTLFGEPLRMRYDGLDRRARYRLRVIYSGRFQSTMTLSAGKTAIHGPIPRPEDPLPMEFDIPEQAIQAGTLELTWHLVNGRGCQVAEVWLLKKD